MVKHTMMARERERERNTCWQIPPLCPGSMSMFRNSRQRDQGRSQSSHSSHVALVGPGGRVQAATSSLVAAATSSLVALGRRALEAFRLVKAKNKVSGDGNNASLLSLGGCNGGGGDAAGVGETWDN